MSETNTLAEMEKQVRSLSDGLGLTLDAVISVIGEDQRASFAKFMTGQTVSMGDDGETRYYTCDVINFLHNGRLFWD